MLDNQFDIPRHQAILGVIIMFVKNARKFLNAVIAIVAYSVIKGGWTNLYIGGMILVGVVAIGLISWLQYKRFWFHVDDQGLQIKEGILNKEKITIPFDRIQTVHLHQSVVQRVLNMTGVKVDTAGSAKKELEIAALTKQDAVALQELLERYKEEKLREEAERNRDVDSDASDSGISAALDAQSPSPAREYVREKPRTLVKLSIYQLLQVGLTQNHIRNGFVAIGAVFGLYWQVDELFNDMIGETAKEYADTIMATWFTIVIAGTILFLVGSVIISVVRTFLRYFDLHAYLTSKALHVNAGLLKRNEFTVPLNKIQFVEWYSNFLRRIPGFESVKIFQGRSEESRKQSVVVPACFEDQTASLMETLFPEADENQEFETYRVHSYYERFLLVIWGAIGTLGAFAVAFFYDPTTGLVALGIFLAILFIWTRKFVRSITLQSNGSMLLYQRGWLFRKRTALKNYKIQSVSWTQSFFQKRRNTAHLTFYTAAGSRTIRFIDADLARALHNYLLYTVERSTKGWM